MYLPPIRAGSTLQYFALFYKYVWQGKPFVTLFEISVIEYIIVCQEAPDNILSTQKIQKPI